MPILNVQVLVIKTLFKYKVLKLSLFMISVIPDFNFKNIYKKDRVISCIFLNIKAGGAIH